MSYLRVFALRHLLIKDLRKPKLMEDRQEGVAGVSVNSVMAGVPRGLSQRDGSSIGPQWDSVPDWFVPGKLRGIDVFAQPFLWRGSVAEPA